MARVYRELGLQRGSVKMILNYTVKQGFSFQGFLDACAAGGVLLVAPSNTGSSNGSASLGDGTVLQVVLCETTVPPTGSGPTGSPGQIALPDLNAAKAVVDAAVAAQS